MKSHKINFDLPQLPFDDLDSETPSSPVKSRPSPASHYAKAMAPKPDSQKEPQQRLLYYISFGSGSSGNSCYIGTSQGGIIIDAGVKDSIIEKTLRDSGVPMSKVHGILLTHDHSDHIRYAYTLLRSNKHLKLFCTNRVLNGLMQRHNVSRRVRDYHVPIFKEIPFKIFDFEITAFEVPHDGSDNMGFSIEFDERRFVLATDLGAVTARAHHYMSQATYLVIEANYDLDMLRLGRYPEYLKSRIQTEIGHMDNTHTAAFLREIINPSLKYIFLCHLSLDNNTPEKALAAAHAVLRDAGLRVGGANETLEDRAADIQLMALPRFEPTRLFVFRP